MVKTHESRSYEPITRTDLDNLRKLALDEHDSFFCRNPHLRNEYYDSLIAACLCQGTASHYLNPDIGIKDWDIWHFYAEDPCVKLWVRKPKRVCDTLRGKPVDFMKRMIPRSICDAHCSDAERIIRHYLELRNTPTKRKLLRKAVIGLFADVIFGEVLWEGEADKILH